MKFEKPEDFYNVYDQHRTYVKPDLRKKHRRQYDEQFWVPASCTSGMSVLEIGCGTGLFLKYVMEKGVTDLLGIELDPLTLDHMPAELASNVVISDIWEFLDNGSDGRRFDRIVLLDVLEHFSPYEGVELLSRLSDILNDGGSITVRVPNVSSPWGLQYQFHDLTHKTAYTPGSLGQVALGAGYELVKYLPQRRGNAFKRMTEKLLFGLISKLITEPPEIWSANMIGILKRK